MDGLTFNEVLFSKTKTETNYHRLESEYYNAKGLDFEDTVKGEEVISFSQYGTSKHCDEEKSGYPVLRLCELENGFITEPQKYCHNLSLEEFNGLKIKKGDVLVVRTNGNPDLVGKSAVVMENTNIAFASYLYRLRTNDIIYPESLVSFLNCKYGRQEINKNSMKGNQTNFSPAKFNDISIPRLSKDLQLKIAQTVEQSYTFVKQSKSIFLESKYVLSQCFNDIDNNILDYKSKKLLSDSFLKTGRLDAEYYQKQYEAIVESLKLNDKLLSLCNLYDDSFIPQSDSEYKYIELANVGSNGEIFNVEKKFGEELPSRARRIVKKGQVIVSSIEGSLSSCALITDEFDGAICSTGFYVVDSECINSETLLVLFKSEAIQSLLKQRCSGTILTAINKEEFLNMPLPMIDDAVQLEIASKVQESFALRKKSKQLLEYAKQAVEIAIEQGEETAIEWLNEKVN